MLIKEIEPITDAGINLLKKENFEKVIDEIIELPLRKACKIFAKKGIETVMSSANKNNVLREGEMPVEKEEINKRNRQFDTEPPLFTDAGKGYAWIMLNFDTLSDENKDWLFELEAKKGQNGESTGERAIWFAHPYEVGSIEHALRIGKFNYEFLEGVMPKEQIPRNIKVDPRLVEFEKRHIVLTGVYSTQTVVLRMPVNSQTTVEEVEEYFASFAKAFKSQIKFKKVEQPEER